MIWAIIDEDRSVRPKCGAVECSNTASLLTYDPATGQAEPWCLVHSRTTRMRKRRVRNVERDRKEHRRYEFF